METTTLKRLYLCEARPGSLDPHDLHLPAGHVLHLCDYCYRWHAVPVHADEAEMLRFAAGMVRFAEIFARRPSTV